MGGDSHGHPEKRKLRGPFGKVVEFLESPQGLILLFTLLVIDVIIVCVSGLLDIQFIVSEKNDCKDYVEKCPWTGSGSGHSRRLDGLHIWDAPWAGLESASDFVAGQSYDERRLGGGGIVCGDPHFGNHSLHDVEKVLAYISIGILVIFFIEQLLDIAGMGVDFFKNRMHVMDLVVIIISLALEVLVTTLPLSGLLIVVRVWRFSRTAHGTQELKHSYKSVKPAAEGAMEAQFRSCVFSKLTSESWKKLADSKDPDIVQDEHLVLVKEIAQENPELLVRCLAFEHARLERAHSETYSVDQRKVQPVEDTDDP
mmetsp:Transcript_104894/g.197668  ORF Transcript_104894/g.197668 Transcript_104894/m.197668 type:complete len:312 (+) Transcript_104894:38-973(+)